MSLFLKAGCELVHGEGAEGAVSASAYGKFKLGPFTALSVVASIIVPSSSFPASSQTLTVFPG